MSDRLTEAMESVCKIAEKVADRKSHDGFSLPLGYLKDVVRPVLRSLCEEIDFEYLRAEHESIRLHAAQQEIDRLKAENKQLKANVDNLQDDLSWWMSENKELAAELSEMER